MMIAVIGPGAMGSLFAAALARSGEDVVLLDHRPERARLLAESGIRVEGISGEWSARIPAVVDPEVLSRAEIVLVCVKAYDTPAAARVLHGRLGPDGMAVTLQNGIGNVEILSEALGAERVICGVTAEGATYLEPGRIRHAGRGPTAVGALPGKITWRTLRVARILATAGFEIEATDDIEGELWGKLIVNAGINPLTAILRVKNGELLRNREALELMRATVEEAVEVACDRGIHLPHDDPAARVEGVARATADNISSMLQDILRARRTEIDSISGAIVREGEARGIPTPVSRALRDLVRALEGTRGARVG